MKTLLLAIAISAVPIGNSQVLLAKSSISIDISWHEEKRMHKYDAFHAIKGAVRGTTKATLNALKEMSSFLQAVSGT